MILSQKKPETLKAWLPSAGYDHRQATIHEFDHVEAITLDDSHGQEYRVNGLMYRCTETGALRLWGYL